MNPWRKYWNKNHNVAEDLYSSSLRRQLVEVEVGGGFGFLFSFCKIFQQNMSSFQFCDNAIINNEIIPLIYLDSILDVILPVETHWIMSI